MFKFFRRVRQALLSENKFSKYLLYAIGEIALVMIGILLALQVNNWNEERKSRSYELTMLSEVNEVMAKDVQILKNWIPHLKSVRYSFNRLASMKNDQEINKDSLDFHLRTIKGYGIVITINKAPFEAIKSGGLDRITNLEIRKNLSNLYGFHIENMERWVNEVQRVELFTRNDLIHELINIRAKPVEGSGVTSEIILENPTALVADPKFDELLERSSWPLSNTIHYLTAVHELMVILIEQIDQELTQ
ncbi:MAG: hypothetical protein JJ892_00130 [Balneola sp.]|nr:hypothetical protein [Balneola sp.]MBO6651919.1 hypothetical protein [Balneola sp.]MBO6709969.1 hypothetical protein [Balneola sp.]MBO6798653.1 hypothetical protein [Balneola sp.]MBO6871876.1 hypothetical protein [Balneola sp.]